MKYPTRNGNSVQLLINGEESYPLRWKLIEEAQDEILIATFSFMKDDTTRRLVDTLIRKMKENVRVKIIYDHIVNQTTFVGPLLKKLEKNGAQLCDYNNLYEGWQFFKLQKQYYKKKSLKVKMVLKQHYHEKYLIVDAKHLILGGLNWGDKYALGGIRKEAWRDTDVYVRGPVVQDVHRQFKQDFERKLEWDSRKKKHAYAYFDFIRSVPVELVEEEIQSSDIQTQNIPIKYIAHKPYDENSLPLTDYYLELIANAKTSVDWGCHGIRPPLLFLEAFRDAQQRGVRIRLITNSKYASKTLMLKGLMGWMYWECSKHFKELIDSNIEIYEWNPQGAYHSKTLIVDQKITSVGSYNIARGSSYHHSESNLIIFDENFAQKNTAQFECDLQQCTQLHSPMKLPKKNAYSRRIHERNKLVDSSVTPPKIMELLERNEYKKMIEKVKPSYYENWRLPTE